MSAATPFLSRETREPDTEYWIKNSCDPFKLAFEIYSNPFASEIDWVFQPCPVDGCIPLKEMVSENKDRLMFKAPGWAGQIFSD